MWVTTMLIRFEEQFKTFKTNSAPEPKCHKCLRDTTVTLETGELERCDGWLKNMFVRRWWAVPPNSATEDPQCWIRHLKSPFSRSLNYFTALLWINRWWPIESNVDFSNMLSRSVHVLPMQRPHISAGVQAQDSPNKVWRLNRRWFMYSFIRLWCQIQTQHHMNSSEVQTNQPIQVYSRSHYSSCELYYQKRSPNKVQKRRRNSSAWPGSQLVE